MSSPVGKAEWKDTSKVEREIGVMGSGVNLASGSRTLSP